MAQEAAAQLVQPMLKAKPAKKAKVAALKPQSQPVAKRKPSPKPSISNKRGRHKTQLQAPPPPPPPAPPPSRDRLAIDDAAEPATESASAASPPLAPTASAISRRESKRPERLVESSVDAVPQHLSDPTRKAKALGGGLRRQQSKIVAVTQPSAGKDIYKVESILQERKGAKGVEFKIRWLDYSSHHDTWEPEANVCTPSPTSIRHASRLCVPTLRC